MLTYCQSVFTVAISVGLVVIFFIVLQKLWPSDLRRPHNETTGWQVGVFGTTYAVIIAFMLSGVWGNFQSASGSVEAEANAVVNVFRLASGLPESQQKRMQDLTSSYVD